MRTLVLAAAALVGTAACAGGAKPNAALAPQVCRTGDSPRVRDELFIGRNIPGGGEISDSAWAEFVAAYVTPRFPDGLTILESRGQWRGASGVIERERGKVLMFLSSDDEAARRLVSEVADEYKRRFRQESVLRVTSRVCVRF